MGVREEAGERYAYLLAPAGKRLDFADGPPATRSGIDALENGAAIFFILPMVFLRRGVTSVGCGSLLATEGNAFSLF